HQNSSVFVCADCGSASVRQEEGFCLQREASGRR
ncbi:hypothetical protein AB1N83_004350, partial [Pleurotus pulmonarius]